MCGRRDGRAVAVLGQWWRQAARPSYGRVPTGYYIISQAGRFCACSSPPRWAGTGGCPGCAASAWRVRHFPARPMATLAACSISLPFHSRAARARGRRRGFQGALCQLPWSSVLRPVLVHAARAASASPAASAAGCTCTLQRPGSALQRKATRAQACAFAHTATPAMQEPHRALSPAGRTRPPAACTLLQWGLWGVGSSWAPAL